MKAPGFRYAPEVQDGDEVELQSGAWAKVETVQSMRGGWTYRVNLADGSWLAFWGNDWVMTR